MIELYKVQPQSDSREILKLPQTELPVRWGPAAKPATCCAAFSSEALYFGGSFAAPPWTFDDSICGRFREGLWERNLLEMFVTQAGSTRYQEFNLSPAGEWWSRVFEGRRKPAAFDFSAIKPGVFVDDSKESRAVSIELPLSSLAFDLTSPDTLRVNFCAYFGKGDISYLSTASLPGTVPDFHQPEAFLPVRIRPWIFP